MSARTALNTLAIVLGVVLGIIVGILVYGWVDGQLGGGGFLENLATFLIALIVAALAGYVTYLVVTRVISGLVASTGVK